MDGLTQIEWSQLSAVALIAVVVVIMVVVLWRLMLVISTMQQQALQAGKESMTLAMQSFRENAAESRKFYTEKLEEMRKGMVLLEGRVHELEDQNEDKDERIAELVDQIEERDKQIASLTDEIAVLRKRMNGTEKKPTARKKAA